MPTRTALVAGATGLVGRQLVGQLLDNPEHVEVVALVRRPLGMTHRKLRELVIDFDRLGELELPRVDDIYCALGTTIKTAGSQEAFRRVDFTYVHELARAGVRAGARQLLVVSSAGADAGSRIFYSRTKGEMEAAVSVEAYESVHIFRPSILVGDRAESRPGERIGIGMMSALSFLMIGPLRKYRPIEAAQVARAMIRTALRGARGVHVYESDEVAAM
jgi:uncharacterized protein YbjT (DUF2867 family)